MVKSVDAFVFRILDNVSFPHVVWCRVERVCAFYHSLYDTHSCLGGLSFCVFYIKKHFEIWALVWGSARHTVAYANWWCSTCDIEKRSCCKCLEDIFFTCLPSVASKNLDFFGKVASLDHNEAIHKFDGRRRMKYGGLQHSIRCTYLRPICIQFESIN